MVFDDAESVFFQNYYIVLHQESVNSDGQQFHQYQLNETITSHLKELHKKGVGNPVSGLVQAQKCGMLNICTMSIILLW